MSTARHLRYSSPVFVPTLPVVYVHNPTKVLRLLLLHGIACYYYPPRRNPPLLLIISHAAECRRRDERRASPGEGRRWRPSMGTSRGKSAASPMLVVSVCMGGRVPLRVLTLCNRCSHRRLARSIFHWVIGFMAQPWQGHALAHLPPPSKNHHPAAERPSRWLSALLPLHLLLSSFRLSSRGGASPVPLGRRRRGGGCSI